MPRHSNRRRGPWNRVCPRCGVTFEVPHERHRKTYCSRHCGRAAAEVSRHVPIANRFWSKVDKSGDCWLWTGHRLKNGYGQFSLTTTRPVKAHRFAWELAHGPIPGGMMVCHHCDNPPCVRPDHLFLGTAKDNTQDAIRKGRMYAGTPGPSRHRDRYLRGERNQNAKLTAEQVKEIRRQRGAKTAKALAVEYGVSFALISHIQNGRVWRHV